METLFENKEAKVEKKENVFEGINDPILNPTNRGVNKVKKCSVCGNILSANEVGVCKKCL
jgi:hypothetical protein